ncbi:MAG: Y-family DNA polymerase [Pyrinomonadaceae bacterium]
MTEVFALCDANNFYVSCERVFNAKLVGRPVVVLSNNDGCIVARSNEARAISGLTMGVPLFQVQDIVDAYGVRVLSSNYALYGDMSQRVMTVLGDFTPEVEVYSIDEAFLRMDEPKRGAPTDFARQIRTTVYKQTGISLSVGLAPTKTLAKLANQLAKKTADAGGVLDLTCAADQERALERTPVENVWGIGRQHAKRLRSYGITTARQLRDVDVRWAHRAMSVVVARIVEELRGNSCLALESCPQSKKSLTCSRSFGRVVETRAELREAVALFTVRVAERLRKNGLAASAITVFVATNRFAKGETYYENSATVEMAYPTDTTPELLERARACAEGLYRTGCKFKKAGVLLTGLVPASPITARMYGDDKWERARRVMRAMDQINASMGRDTIKLGVTYRAQSWKTKFEKRSPNYTTNWNELLCVA